jgi:uncharacterized protein HemY
VIRILMVAFMLAVLAAQVVRLPAVREWRARRREIRAAHDQVRHLHSGHIDALPRTGGPKEGERDGH